MIEIIDASETDLSIGYFKKLRESLFHDLTHTELIQEPQDVIRMFARLYAILNLEINYAECIFDLGTRREEEMERWGRTLDSLVEGNWNVLSTEIRRDAKRFVADFQNFEQVELGYCLQELSLLI